MAASDIGRNRPTRRRAPLRPRSAAKAKQLRARRASAEARYGDGPVRCEAKFSARCTAWAVTEHHRRRQSRGGNDSPANRVPICAECHTGGQGVHNRIAAARAAGLIVHEGDPRWDELGEPWPS